MTEEELTTLYQELQQLKSNLEQKEILLNNVLKYIPTVYYQVSYNGSSINKQGYDYKIERGIDIPQNGLLFIVPLYSSKAEDDENKVTLTIKQNGITLDPRAIMVETSSGILRKVQSGDILANRMAIFRFKPGSDTAILINSPLYNEASYSHIVATKAEFLDMPTVVVANTLPSAYPTLVTSTEFNALKERVDALDERTIFGTEDAETALADSQVGTIYIQVEEED